MFDTKVKNLFGLTSLLSLRLIGSEDNSESKMDSHYEGEFVNKC